MENMIEIVTILAPAALVLATNYLFLRHFQSFSRDGDSDQASRKILQITLPLQLQAHERMVLFLERSIMTNLIPRVNQSDFTVSDLRTALSDEIRKEFTHNLVQQIYLSGQAWTHVSQAFENAISMLNQAYGQVRADDPGIELIRELLKDTSNSKINADAILILKGDARRLMNPHEKPETTS